jgi:hypothetical protein
MIRARHAMAPFVLCGALAFHARDAAACGVTTGGAAGLSGCSLSEHEEAARPKFRAGASYAFTSTSLRFDGSRRVDEIRHAAVASLEWRPTPTLTAVAGAGVFGGVVETPTTRAGFAPGFVSVLGGSWRAIDASSHGEGGGPFLLFTGQLSYATTTTDGGYGYNAVDLRIGAIVGMTFAKMITPYVVERGFGGPIYWRLDGEAVRGTDVYHYQLGAGVSALVAKRLDLFVEGVPFGERGASAGAGFSF